MGSHLFLEFSFSAFLDFFWVSVLRRKEGRKEGRRLKESHSALGGRRCVFAHIQMFLPVALLVKIGIVILPTLPLSSFQDTKTHLH